MSVKAINLKSGTRIKLHDDTVEVVSVHIHHGMNLVMLEYKCSKGYTFSAIVSSTDEYTEC